MKFLKFLSILLRENELKKINKIIFFVSFLFIAGNIYPQQYWTRLNSPTINYLYKCDFVDSLYGWAVGDSGTIVHTSNGGINWVAQNSKINFPLQSVYFINRRLGWALAWEYINYFGTVILKTTDGGSNWDTTYYPAENVYLRSVYFLDSLTGFMGGSPANIIKTTNGGNDWNYCSVDSVNFMSFPIVGFNFLNSQMGYAYGGVMDIAGIIWRTTNRGNNWHPSVNAPEPVLGIHFIDSNFCFGLSGDFEYGPAIIKSYDNGVNWNYKSLLLFGSPSNLSFRTKTEAWTSLVYSQKFVIFQDTGSFFSEIDTPDSSYITDITFIDSTHGFCIGGNGVIYKYINQTSVIINNNNVYIDINNYNKINSISIDYALMEKSNKIGIIPANILWSDVGTWKSLWQLKNKDDNQRICHYLCP